MDKLYSEFNNKHQLHALDQNIDVKRFETDAVYRHETILGLSDSLDTFKLACSLAKFYSLDLWDVYMSLTRNLFLEHAAGSSSITLTELETHLKPLSPLLHRKLDRFAAIMRDQVLVTISGADLDTLAVYFTVLNDPQSQCHVKLIGKLKSADFNLAGFDYKVTQALDFRKIEKMRSFGQRFTYSFLYSFLAKSKLNIEKKN